jgi:hypothetical protein
MKISLIIFARYLYPGPVLYKIYLTNNNINETNRNETRIT